MPRYPGRHLEVVLRRIAAIALLRCLPAALLLAGCDGVLYGPIAFEEDPLLEDRRSYNLQRLNEIRAEHGLPPYVLDDCLSDIAQRANDTWIQSDELHGVFSRECLFSSRETCACGWAQENQGWGRADALWQDELDMVLQIMMDEGPGGGHHDNIVSTEWTRVGIGVRLYRGVLYFTNDFAP